MYYLIYKTTNIINNKYYIGKHQTKNIDDGYLGSGKLLRRAIEKYGKENFVREIIMECSTEKEMNLAEKILVVPDIETNYNLCSGGHGGFGYLNSNGLNLYGTNGQFGVIKKAQETHCLKLKSDIEYRVNHIENSRKGGEKTKELFPNGTFHGKTHSNNAKLKIGKKNSEKQKGSNNSQFGTCWMTDGVHSVKIKRCDVDSWVEAGYFKGRTF